MDKVIREGKVAVLYSPGYGSGWYSWSNSVKEMIFHPELVELIENNRYDEITEELIEELFPNKGVYIGSNVRELEIKWIPQGTKFRIDEYDGAESVVIMEDDNWIVA